jgi:hypothetical protein
MSPDLALAYLRELSPSVTAAVLLDEKNSPLAGDPALADRSEGASGSAIIISDGERSLIADVAPDAPRALVEFDARLAMAAVRGRC